MGRDHGRSLFFGAVDLGRDKQAVPMDNLREGRFIVHIHRDGPALAEAQDRTRRRTVISGGLNGASRSDFQLYRRDAQRYVGFRVVRCGLGGQRSQKLSAIHGGPAFHAFIVQGGLETGTVGNRSVEDVNRCRPGAGGPARAPVRGRGRPPHFAFGP